ncbi:uncharacterized protein LOC62_05G007123 [Vanrija pseudolonga]|uniref:Uncharacterized protein n=1 Tax=Vanrija pseudolonga TaxID=143232 RepID=A0AAF0YHC9_9TREE|nr:hypothetical protein LOC62_05G007123 [Vanrija pseudolonga]
MATTQMRIEDHILENFEHLEDDADVILLVDTLQRTREIEGDLGDYSSARIFAPIKEEGIERPPSPKAHVVPLRSTLRRAALSAAAAKESVSRPTSRWSTVSSASAYSAPSVYSQASEVAFSDPAPIPAPTTAGFAHAWAFSQASNPKLRLRPDLEATASGSVDPVPQGRWAKFKTAAGRLRIKVGKGTGGRQ